MKSWPSRSEASLSKTGIPPPDTHPVVMIFIVIVIVVLAVALDVLTKLVLGVGTTAVILNDSCCTSVTVIRHYAHYYRVCHCHCGFDCYCKYDHYHLNCSIVIVLTIHMVFLCCCSSSLCR